MSCGGYIIIDFKNTNLTTEGVIIDGIYERLEANHRKAILLSNGVVNGTERADCFAFATVSGTDYHLYYGNPAYYIKVTEDNTVSLVSV